jgi:pimeloyl-ACP methyl ester carboxylesterase
MKATSPVTTILILLLAAVALGAYLLWTPDKPRATLEATYLRSAADYLDLPGQRIHLRDTGPRDKPAVIMLHGFASSLHTWEPWAQSLSATHRVITLDLPGSGLSTPDPTGDYSDPRSIETLAAILDQLNLKQVSLIGHSMGGKIAWKFAAKYPELVTKLVLVSPDGFIPPGSIIGKPPTVPLSMQMMRFVLPKSMLKSSLAVAFGDPTAFPPSLVTRYYDMMLAPGSRAALLARLAQATPVDPVPLLKSISTPTLLVWGENDRMIPFTNSADYLATLPNVKLANFPTLGHVPHEEAPSLSLPAVTAFLAN